MTPMHEAATKKLMDLGYELKSTPRGWRATKSKSQLDVRLRYDACPNTGRKFEVLQVIRPVSCER